MDLAKYIIIPIIGAVIGLCTNWLAVKMLFRPLKAKHIGKFKVPFTPGLIPKSKPRLAKSIANAIGESLLTKKDLSEKLLSEELTENVAKSIVNNLKAKNDSDSTICQILNNFLGTNEFEQVKKQIVTFISSKAQVALKNANIGELVAKEGSQILIEKAKGSFLAMFINDQTVPMLVGMLSDGINDYIDKNGENKMGSMIEKMFDEATSTPISNLVEVSDETKLVEIVKNIYKNILMNNVESLIEKINLEEIVEDKINEMEVKELEKLVLSVMKKELNAIVWLGGLLGLIIGLINLIFI